MEHHITFVTFMTAIWVMCPVPACRSTSGGWVIGCKILQRTTQLSNWFWMLEQKFKIPRPFSKCLLLTSALIHFKRKAISVHECFSSISKLISIHMKMHKYTCPVTKNNTAQVGVNRKMSSDVGHITTWWLKDCSIITGYSQSQSKPFCSCHDF